MHLVFVGPPGAGKGTQARLTAEALGIKHVSTGDLLREAVARKSALGEEARGYMDQGRLVPDPLVDRLVADKLQAPECKDGILLDGYPRNLSQAEAFDQVEVALGKPLDAVIHLDVPDAVLLERLTGRRSCPKPGCGAMYHVRSQAPRQEGRCDRCDTPLVVRSDDRTDVVAARLKVYHDETEPVLAHYRRRGIVKRVDGTPGIEPVMRSILDVLGAVVSPVDEKVMGIVSKSRAELEHMDRANAIVLTVLRELAAMARPGVPTHDLDRHAEKRILEMEARPAFKGYRGYPYTLCVSINEQVVHGMPSKRTLRDGDVVGLDLGAIVAGYYGDAAMTVPVGKVGEEPLRLISATRESLRLAIGTVVAGNRVSDIGRSVQSYVEPRGYSVVREFVGHGIGTQLHEEPQVPNFEDKGRGNPRLKPGMVLAIEPMVNAGGHKVRVGKDGWTASTVDGSLSAHFERSVAVTEQGPWILGESLSGVTL